MAAIEKRKKEKVTEMKVKITWKEIKRQKALLIWSAFIVLYGVIFCYLPLGGWLMAFQGWTSAFSVCRIGKVPAVVF